jgi:quercetin dioxygenase-like cupin family protein
VRTSAASGEEHWHGATPEGFMEHLAVYDTSAEPPLGVHWLEHVTDEDCNRR